MRIHYIHFDSLAVYIHGCKYGYIPRDIIFMVYIADQPTEINPCSSEWFAVWDSVQLEKVNLGLLSQIPTYLSLDRLILERKSEIRVILELAELTSCLGNWPNMDLRRSCIRKKYRVPYTATTVITPMTGIRQTNSYNGHQSDAIRHNWSDLRRIVVTEHR